MRDRPTEIYRAANAQQAQLLRNMLEERGIQAFVVNDFMQGAGGDLPLGWTAAPQVLVAEEDVSKGRLIAEQFDATMRGDSSVATEEFDVADDDWKDWPLCPNCRWRRDVLCDICGSRGTKFALADLVDEPDRQSVLLHCDTCDDHFRPQFFRICHHCGHDYGSGLELQPVQQEIPLPENTRRTWLVAGGLVAFSAAIIIYLYWLVSR